MKGYMFNPSLAGTGKQYLALQARVYGNNEYHPRHLHVQGEGDEGNRYYGVAQDLDLEPETLEWFGKLPHTLDSLAKTGAKYAPLQARLDGDEVRFQVAGPELNRWYGAAFRVPVGDARDLAEWLGYESDEEAETGEDSYEEVDEEVDETVDIEKSAYTMTPSLAGRAYVAMQGAVRYGRFHVQGKGPEANRSYGISADLPVDYTLLSWLQDLNAALPSLAGSERKYFPIQGVVNGDTIHIQIAGPELNRDYGAVIDISKDQASELHTWLRGT